MSVLRLVLGDQLTQDGPALQDIDATSDVVLMVEVAEETTYVRHHKQKLVLVLSAMRHFADALRAQGLTVDYVQLDDPANTGDFSGEVGRAIARHRATRLIATEPGEYRVLEAMQRWSNAYQIDVEIRDDTRFFASGARFRRWASDKKSLRMEFFYRDMRRETGLLMRGSEPIGGKWNFDPDNRKPLPRGMSLPDRAGFTPDAITREVMELVATRFHNHFGDLEPFRWAVTRADALSALDDFISDCLPSFGDHQDAMQTGEPFLYHGLISPYLNLGLLTPREVCLRAETAYRTGEAPINAVEGFIRQILGWREYVRGIYWLKMPDYATTNALQATRPLPWFFWSGETDMHCLATVIAETRANAYAHHIQRLMIVGNFALLSGLSPREVEAWYLIVYADAYEWVELPNTHGMALYADGGLLASKPYAASGAYIDRMSDYCGGCFYDPKLKSGAKACPFNYLYWDFLIRNAARLQGNPRLAMPYRSLGRFSDDRRAEIAREATAFLDRLDATASPQIEAQGRLF